MGNPVPKRLKEARERLGISQKQLGIKAGIDEFSASSRVNHYEKGRHVPSIDMAERLAKVLKIPAAFLFTSNNEMSEIIRLANKLPTTKRKNLIHDLKIIIKE